MEENKIIMIDTITEDRTIEYSVKTVMTADRFENKSLKADYTPKPYEKIFIYPDADVPKFKVKPFCDKYKVSLVRDHRKANQMFVGTSYLQGIKSKHNHPVKNVNTHRFIKWLNEVTYAEDTKYTALRTLLQNYTRENIAMSTEVMYTLHYNYSAHINPFGKHLIEMSQSYDIDWMTLVDKQVEDSILYLERADNIYSSECLLKYMNEGIIIDEQMYNNFRSILNSKDTSNHVIAVEAMANCDYTRSSVWILLLIYDFREEIRNCKASSHVNFSTLKTYFNIDVKYPLSLENIITTLSDKDILSKGRLATIMDRVNAEHIADNSTNLFNASKMYEKDELIEKITPNQEEVVDLIDEYNDDLSLEEC